mmetsp:Transcript_53174/g.156634  ORF Transcript_53174/g.156634 Transcript_53174/m.156634 type:complete len:215 (-) Transcript_53174:488-1132(-)
MSGTSRPRAATSVAMRMSKELSRNACIVTSRCACGMSPCSTWLTPDSPELSASSFASALVSAKMIVFTPGPPYTARTSRSVAGRSLQRKHLTARWVMSVEVFCFSCPTMSTVMGSVMYFFAVFWTQDGMVADQRSLWILAGFGCWVVAASRILSMSSWKPMSSISSASSSTRNLSSLSLRLPRLRWSMMRPGVPTTTSTPRLSVLSCGWYMAPP